MDKLYLIIITHALNVNIDSFTVKLNINIFKPLKQIDFYSAQSIGDSVICIGKYKDKILVVSSEKVFDFYSTDISSFEKLLCDLFPKSEISVLTLYSVVELYGYTVINNGKRLRVKSGGDSEVYINYGNKLKEELDIESEQIFDDEELKEMKSEYTDKEVLGMVENEVGIRVTNRLLRRYFGGTDSEVYNNLDKIKFIEFKL